MSQRPKLGLGNWYKFTIQQRIYTKQIHPPVKELPCVTLQMSLLGSHWHHPRLSLLGPKFLCSGSSSDPVGPRLAPCPPHTHTGFLTGSIPGCPQPSPRGAQTCWAPAWPGFSELEGRSAALTALPATAAASSPSSAVLVFLFQGTVTPANSSEFLSPLKWTGN